MRTQLAISKEPTEAAGNHSVGRVAVGNQRDNREHPDPDRDSYSEEHDWALDIGPEQFGHTGEWTPSVCSLRSVSGLAACTANIDWSRARSAGMYAVVGCSECQALWIIEGRPERSECPRCGTSRKYEKRREFVTTDDEDHAREVRSSMLAARQDQSDAFAALDSFAELDEQVEESGIDDETYLSESGIDPEEVAAAGEAESTNRSREEIVRAGIREQSEPTAQDVIAYASEHGVSASYTERALEKLKRAGEVSEHSGSYRLL